MQPFYKNPDFWDKKQTFFWKKSGSGPKSGNPDLVGDTGYVIKKLEI